MESVARAVRGAVDMARRLGCPVLCAGSLYTYGDVVAALKTAAE